MMVTPLERFPLTTCNLSRVIPSLNEASLTGPLEASNPGQVACEISNGMSLDFGLIDLEADPPRFESTNNLGDLQQHFSVTQSSDFSVAAWITPDTTDPRAGRQPIVTFGTTTPVPSEDRMICPGYDFQLAQVQKKILVSYTDNDTCRYLFVKNFRLTNSLTHVAVTFDSSHTNVFIDGEAMVMGAPNYFDMMLQNWNLTDSSLQLFGDYTSNNYFEGSIHQVDIFDQYLAEAQVAAVFNEGVVRGAPSPSPTRNAQPSGSPSATMSPSARPSLPPSLHPSTSPSLQPSTSPSLQPSSSPSTNPSVEPSAIPPEISVFAKGVQNAVLRQDSMDPLPLILGSMNTTSSVLQLEVEILSLPRYGVLMYDAFEITVESRFPLEIGKSELSINYRLLSADYFNAPTVNAYGIDLELDSETFDFRVNAYNVESQLPVLVAVSPTLTQSMTVLHVNHPPTLSAPEEAVLDTVDMSHATVAGVSFTDSLDFNLDRVRVDIWAKQGQVTLTPSYLSRADFGSCLYQGLLPWHCDGIQESNMTFLAIPGDVPLLLSKLAYNSLNPDGSGDEITIRVSDGAGGTCLKETEHVEYGKLMGNTLTSIRDDCFQIEATIRVPGYVIDPALKDKEENVSSGLFGSDFFEVPDLLFYGLLIFLIVLCTCCLRQIPRCLARGSAVEVDDNSLSENVCDEAAASLEEDV